MSSYVNYSNKIKKNNKVNNLQYSCVKYHYLHRQTIIITFTAVIDIVFFKCVGKKTGSLVDSRPQQMQNRFFSASPSSTALLFIWTDRFFP